MTEYRDDFERARGRLLSAAVGALEGALPSGTVARRGAGRDVWDVLAPHLTIGDVQPALGAIHGGPGGELSATSAGNIAFCSAESSALMAVNFLAPFGSRGGFLGLPAGVLSFERELRVDGVRAPIGPTLDAVLDTPAGSVTIEAKVCEPWRGPPKRTISPQYDQPAAALSSGVRAAVESVRTGSSDYRCLDAAQLLKHLLGISSAVRAGRLREPADLILLYWRPANSGAHAGMFDRLKAEISDFADRVSDQPIRVRGISTCRLLAAWVTDSQEWLREHATNLSQRYNAPL